MVVVDLLRQQPAEGLQEGVRDNFEESLCGDDQVSMHSVISIGVFRWETLSLLDVVVHQETDRLFFLLFFLFLAVLFGLYIS